MAKSPPKYPPHPASNWDYSVRESARQALRKPNKNICIYCHRQAVSEEDISHLPDCPAKPKTVVPKEVRP